VRHAECGEKQRARGHRVCAHPLGRGGMAAAPDSGMPNLARILVPTDFSAPSDGAVAFAKTLAHKFGASLHLIHVLEDWPMREVAAAQKLLDAVLTPEERETLKATSVLLRGATAATIVNYAATHAIDLIVMGTEGHGAHGSLGRVVESVVRMGPCPVLTVKEERDGSVSEQSIGHAASTFV
jgi:nucleotide-binding universal stress UspA family protein